jgi:ubiquinone biosynthesis protein
VPSLSRAFGIFWIAVRQLVLAGLHSLLARWPELARRIAGPELSGPKRLKASFEQAGGAFIKLGQLLALQPDILPLRYCNELYDLLDRVEPSPFEEIEAVFVAELGRTPAQVFERFEREPLSTASIGQVHVGYRDGRKYAVKIRRQGADAEFAEDIRLMDGLLRLVEFVRAERFFWLRSPITEFIDWTSEELDYRQEARYMEEIRRNSEDDFRSRVPRIDWDLTTRRTLVVEFCEGTTVLDLLRSFDSGDPHLLRRLKDRGFDPKTAARTIIDIFLRDAFMHGIFHADLHPANLLIMPGNVIGYVDFGITGTLSVTTRRRLAGLTIAWSLGDLDQVCETFFQLSAAPTESQKQVYRDGLKTMAADWYQTVDGQRRLTRSFTLVMLEMLALSHRTGIMPDRSVSRYLRSAMATDGLVKRFAPGLDVAAELEAGCRRYLTSLLVKDLFSFDTVASWSALMMGYLEQGGGDAAPPRSQPLPAASTRTARSRVVRRFAAVAFVFAALGTLTPGGPGLGADLLTAELGVSLLAALLVVAALGRSG